ncbi:protein translocase subunit SecD [Hyphomonas sp. FCG-A18]|uniref:protein translocase subunit SecD n=1 Tax=Hyphomonas sp. FCG-A18 TaxID=3080019 RepID=UPI002B2D6192|nr:protein translocase subunit SecD [Hyphomonas sp. FCG-A18]
MLNFPAWKVAIISITLLWGALLALPNLFSDGFLGIEPRDTGATDPQAIAAYEQQLAEADASWWPGFLPKNKLSLGLDLQGGVYLLMEIDPAEVVGNQFESFKGDVRDAWRQTNNQEIILRDSEPVISDSRMIYQLRDPQEDAQQRFDWTAEEQMEDALKRLRRVNPNIGTTQTKTFNISEGANNTVIIAVTDASRSELTRKARNDMMTTIRNRIDPNGVAEIQITPQGDDRIILEAPGESDPKRIKDLLSRDGRLTFNMADTSGSAVRIAQETGRARPGWQLIPSREGFPLLINNIPEIEGKDIASANRCPDPDDNTPSVCFRLNSSAAKKFYNLTASRRGELFAIVLDGESMSAPRINDPIPGGNVIITGDFTIEEADDLSAIIAAGELAAKPQFIEERTVGPGLGQESIAAGSRASMIGIILVGIFMMLAYGLIGGFAVGSLIANIILIVGALSGFGATLTLPGIAGIILTIGMAVDANVIVFERIREEQRSGRSPATAIQAGYERAFSAILDANVTTFIAASILYLVGAGPVKGFAVTLAIGILTSVFTAFVVTRWFTVMYLRTMRPKRLAM